MKKAILPIAFISIIVILGAFLITKEYNRKQKPEVNDMPVTEEVVNLDELTATDLVLLVGLDDAAGKLTLRYPDELEDFELTYDKTVQFANKYGDPILATELMNGEMLNILYSKHSKKLLNVQVSDSTWTMTDMTDYSIDDNRKIMTIMGEKYQYGPELLVYSENEPIRIMDITDMDTLTIKGYNRKVCSIIVDDGHGYLRIKNDAYFVGGFIEVGQKIIRQITDDMLLTVPEGRYKVKVTNRGYAGEENVVIVRGRETELDLSKIDVEEVAIGHVLFELSPEYAQLYIDGEITDYEERVPLEYGAHKIRVEAAGYKTVETNIKVGDDYANVSIELDELSDAEEEEDSDEATPTPSPAAPTPTPTETVQTTESNDTSSDESTITISEKKKIFVESPVDTEVYLDGNYIGVTPVSTGKVTGSHTITLSKSGYITKDYTIYVENDDNDVTLSFSELLAE